jgi:hypothetical protein
MTTAITIGRFSVSTSHSTGSGYMQDASAEVDYDQNRSATTTSANGPTINPESR